VHTSNAKLVELSSQRERMPVMRPIEPRPLKSPTASDAEDTRGRFYRERETRRSRLPML